MARTPRLTSASKSSPIAARFATPIVRGLAAPIAVMAAVTLGVGIGLAFPAAALDRDAAMPAGSAPPAPTRAPTVGVALDAVAPGSMARDVVALGPASGALAAPRAGWPVSLGTPGGGFPYTPTLYDIDGDGADEIFMTGGHTFGLRGDGNFLPGWPTVEMPDMGYGTNDNKPGPSVADLEGDGAPEILWSERDWWAGSSHMWCFNAKRVDGSNLPGFPQAAIDQPSNALDVPFVLGDTDGDGDLEAWGPHTNGNNFVHYRISAFDHLGNRLFTINLARTENVLSLYFGDLDGNGAREMFAVSWLSPDYRLHVFTAEGAEAPGYPITLRSLASGWLPFGPPVVADLDGDGDLEILLGHWDSAGSRVYAQHHDGSDCAGYPVEIAANSQLFYFNLGDLTGDGAPELIATDNDLASDYRVHAIDLATGLPLPGWPVPVVAWPEGFPAIADVTGDGLQDVCFVTGAGELFAVSGAGVVVPGYPRMMTSPSISGVAVGDIDADGLFELVAATWDGWVYAWETMGQALPELADWPLRNVDARNTGVFGQRIDPAAVAWPRGAPAARLAVAPRLARGQVAFIHAPDDAAWGVEIFAPDGRIVERLAANGTTRLTWDANASAAGVYFARLRGVPASSPVRFVIVR
jgi:hypothetical protein